MDGNWNTSYNAESYTKISEGLEHSAYYTSLTTNERAEIDAQIPSIVMAIEAAMQRGVLPNIFVNGGEVTEDVYTHVLKWAQYHARTALGELKSDEATKSPVQRTARIDEYSQQATQILDPLKKTASNALSRLFRGLHEVFTDAERVQADTISTTIIEALAGKLETAPDPTTNQYLLDGALKPEAVQKLLTELSASDPSIVDKHPDLYRGFFDKTAVTDRLPDGSMVLLESAAARRTAEAAATGERARVETGFGRLLERAKSRVRVK
jgi:hypothetical protein